MNERELCPLCGVPLEDEPGPVLEGDCPVHEVIGRLKGVDEQAPTGLLGQEDEDGLSGWSGEFGETLPVGTAGWRQVDAFAVGEGGDEARGFAVVDELDCFRSTQKLRYPDGTTVETHGMAHEGGKAMWTLEGLQPGHDTLIIVQTDVMYAGGDLRVEAGGGTIVFPDFAPDRRYRARNRAIPIPGTWVDDEPLSVALGRLESDKPLSHFAVWVYQSRTPVPEPFDDESLADAPLDGRSVEHEMPSDPPVSDEPDALDDSLVDPEPPVDEASVDEAMVDDEDASLVDPPVDDGETSLIDPPVDDEDASLVDPPVDDAGAHGAPVHTAPVPRPDAAGAMAAADEAPGAVDAAVDAPGEAEDERLETVDIPASALLQPPSPPPLGADDAEEPAPTPAEPEPAADTDAPAAAEESEPAADGPAASEAGDTNPTEQKLVTITLADADHAHGTGHAHLASELRAGWRIVRLECLPGPRGGWLVVLLER